MNISTLNEAVLMRRDPRKVRSRLLLGIPSFYI